jgi:hypothetical protein
MILNHQRKAESSTNNLSNSQQTAKLQQHHREGNGKSTRDSHHLHIKDLHAYQPVDRDKQKNVSDLGG